MLCIHSYFLLANAPGRVALGGDALELLAAGSGSGSGSGSGCTTGLGGAAGAAGAAGTGGAVGMVICGIVSVDTTAPLVHSHCD